MNRHRLQRWLTVGAMLALPVLAQAQEATLSGTVTDTTGGALPGVTVRAVHETTGNSFEAVTDERGDFRLAVRVGAYRVTADLPGFAPATRSTTLLVGQVAVLDLQLAVSGLQETVTVTGEAPLLDVTQSSLGGNIDPRQMQEIPIQGRDWMALVMLAPGSRANAIGTAPTAQIGRQNSRGDFQVNMDGQQVTALMSYTIEAGAQPSFSREAIAEFELVTSRFDATQGRSAGLQVNAVTKSGTNTPAGSFAGYFRDDRFNAADFVAKRVLPYQNQQLAGTFGGPLRKDRVHAFGYYEFEREPSTAVYTTPYPHFNVDVFGVKRQHKTGGRLDMQFSPQTRLAVRPTVFKLTDPPSAGGGSAVNATSPDGDSGRAQYTLLGALTQVLSNRAVNEIKVGYTNLATGIVLTTGSRIRNPLVRSGWGGPSVQLRGLTVGGGGCTLCGTSTPSQHQTTYSIRDDFTYSFTKGGRHTLKLGGEYIYLRGVNGALGTPDNGTLDARGGPIPANIESLFPDIFDPATWNLTPLSPISISWRQAFGYSRIVLPRYISAGWVQDDWTVSPRLTLNLGVRYDLEANAFANKAELLPFLPGNRPDDTNNFGPRAGFTFSVNDRTVLRGGFGLYYGTVTSGYFTVSPTRVIVPIILSDGRPDFASNPFNGPTPTDEEAVAKRCTPALEPGCIRNGTYNGMYSKNAAIPFSYQPSIGVQRQLSDTMAIEADYVYVGIRKNLVQVEKNINLTYNPATGANYPFTDISRRPYPWWDVVLLRTSDNYTDQHSLQTGWTKRMSGGWQASASYTLSALWGAYGRPQSGNDYVPFPTVSDLGGEYTLAVGDQRHRAVVNGIWELPYDFQLSGLYFFGSGERQPTSYGLDLRSLGGRADVPGAVSGSLFEQRLRPDGTIVKRNDFVGKPIHRVDMRLQRRFPLAGRAGIDGILEIFNVFNHANFGSYTTQEVSRNNRRPSQNPNVAYTPRALQLGFRLGF